MRRSMIRSLLAAASCLAAVPAMAADMEPYMAPYAARPEPYVVQPVEPLVVPRVVIPVEATPCWRYGRLGWGWYPCYAPPRAYWVPSDGDLHRDAYHRREW